MSTKSAYVWFGAVLAGSLVWVAFFQPPRFEAMNWFLGSFVPTPSVRGGVATFAFEGLLVLAPFAVLAVFVSRMTVKPPHLWAAAALGFVLAHLMSIGWNALVFGSWTSSLYNHIVFEPWTLQFAVDGGAILVACGLLVLASRHRPTAARSGAARTRIASSV